MFGLFIIQAGREPVPLLDFYNLKQEIFDRGDDAARVADQCARGEYRHSNGYAPVKVQVRPIKSDAWKTREAGRFTDGTYMALPWVLPARDATAEHYAHISTEDGAKIAYTQDAAKGVRDIQTRVKPGKYLAQFYGDHFDAPTIARMAAEFNNQHGENIVLQFADTQEEIERVYVNGPRSCMAHPAAHFDSKIHPVRVYAAGDLAVAYIVRDDRITARALCWPEKKRVGRVYGDETRLVDLLEEAGYTGFSARSLNGARMLRIADRGAFVCPYVDGDQCVGDDGKHLILGGDTYGADNSNGLSCVAIRCDDCRGGFDEYDCLVDDDGNSYCQDCYNERFGYCELYQENCPRDTMHEVHCTAGFPPRRTTQMWSERAFETDAFVCAGTGENYSNDLRVELADGTDWSQYYFDDHGSICDGNGECYRRDDMLQLEDGTMWSQDYFADNGVEVDGKFYAKGDEPVDEEAELKQEEA